MRWQYHAARRRLAWAAILTLLILAGTLAPASSLPPAPALLRTPTLPPLCPGESVTDAWTVALAPAPPRADVVFAVDTGRTMHDTLLALDLGAHNILRSLHLRFPDVRFGLVAFSDYPTSPYGSASDEPYGLVQPLTPDRDTAERALKGLQPAWGGDPPDAYTRALSEAATDPHLGWRPDARRFLVLIGDSFPHDDDLNAGLPTPQPYRPGEPWITGYRPTYRDPGPDATPGTAADLDFQAVLGLLRTRETTLLGIVTSHAARAPGGAELTAAWEVWAGMAGAGGGATHVPYPYTGTFGPPEIELALTPLMEEAGRHIGRLTVQTSPPDYAAWVVTDPPAYTDLVVPSNGTTVDFQVTLRVPPDTPPGTHSFVLQVVGDGAVYAEQPVTIQVQSKCPPVPTWTPTPSPTATPPPPTPTPTLPLDRCVFAPDKQATPAALELGDTTQITLRLDGACPTKRRHIDLMLVVDVSDPGTLDLAQPALRAFVDGWDLATHQVGLVSYGRSARLDAPLTHDAGQVQATIDRLSVRYLFGPNLGHGIALAQAELESERRHPAAVPVILVLASARPVLNPSFAISVAAAAREAGTRIFAIGPPDPSAGSGQGLGVAGIVASPEDYFLAGNTVETLLQATEYIANLVAHDYRTNVLATDVTVQDVLSPSVAYLPGLGMPVPTPVATGEADALTWHLPAVSPDGVELTYHGLPLVAGTYEANTSAWADLTDGEGNAVTVPFPNPQLAVHAGQPDAALCPGESTALTVSMHLFALPHRADVILAVDTTADMFRLIPVVNTAAAEIIDRLAVEIPDLQVGVIDFRDYPVEPYGEAEDWPYRLRQPLTDDREQVAAALQGLAAGGGGDPPEAYTRALYESYSDPAIRWRPGARRLVALIGNQMPHDDDLNAGIPTPQPFHRNEPWPTGYPPSYLDPGRDGYPGTVDDLDFQAVLQGMRTQGISLLGLMVGFRGVVDDRTVYWRHWAGLTGASGVAIRAEAGQVPETLASLVAEASRHLGELHIEVVPESYASWVTINPPAYTDLSVPPQGMMVPFDVTIHVPRGALAGPYTFLLRAVGDGAVADQKGLVVEVPAACWGIVTSTPTSTATASPTPTATHTPTATATPTATPGVRRYFVFLPAVFHNRYGMLPPLRTVGRFVVGRAARRAECRKTLLRQRYVAHYERWEGS